MKTTFQPGDKVVWVKKVVARTGFDDDYGPGPFKVMFVQKANRPDIHPQEVFVCNTWFNGAYFKKVKA